MTERPNPDSSRAQNIWDELQELWARADTAQRVMERLMHQTERLIFESRILCSALARHRDNGSKKSKKG